MRKILLAFLFLALLSASLHAHQPRLVEERDVREHQIQIDNPEISQAFYAELHGGPDFYAIETGEAFDFYAGVLVPDLEGIGKDVSFRVYQGDQVIHEALASDHDWSLFYEEFAGDHYYQGPEVEMRLPAGTYYIEAYSPDNQGKYVLAVGKIESFSLNETLETLIILPALKQTFFEKPFWTAYFNLIGLFVFGPVIVLAGISFAAYFYLKRRGKPGRKNKKRIR